MIARAPLTFLAASLMFWGCTINDELRTLKNDQNDDLAPAQAIASAPKLVVELSDSAIEELQSGQLAVPQGYELERVIPEDPEFEERHRAAGLHRLYFVNNTGGAPLTRAEGELASIPGVVQLERIPRNAPDAIPFNDPYSDRQWHLYNDGTRLNKFVAGMDLNVVPVWNEFTAGTNNVIVGVMDTGVQYDHPDLSKIVIPAGSSGSKSFLNSTSSDPYNITPQRHGTHVAGIIAAINNNGTGVCGVAGGKNGQGGVRILDLQVIATQDGDSGNIYSAMVWAADHGAVILNNSWNSTYTSESDVPTSTSFTYKRAIDYFIDKAGTDGNGNQTGPMKGGAVFFSAGNKGWSRSQPSMYEGNISVGAIGPAGEASTYTNYGEWVDLCAPGGNASGYANTTDPQMYSTMAGGGYYQMQGTSQAAPCASGVAALIVSYFGGDGFTPERLREILVNGADVETIKNHSKYIGPMIDAYGSFLYALDTPLTPQKDISATETSESLLSISWTLNKYGSQNYYKNILCVSSNKSKLENLDPFNLPSDIITRTYNGRDYGNGARITEVISGLAYDRDWYFTVVSYTRNHLHTTGNTIGSFHLRKNNSPVLNGNYTGPVSLNHHDSKVFTLHYSDPDGDALTVTTNPGSAAGTWQDNHAGTLTFTIDGNGAPAGSYTASVTASDGIIIVSSNIYYTIVPNKIPVLKQEGWILAPIRYRETAMLRVRCTDPDEDALTVSTVPGSPAATWTDEGDGVYRLDLHGDSAPAGTYTASISASDGFDGSASHSIEYTLVGNTAPELYDAIPDQIVISGTTRYINLNDYFRDKEGDMLLFSVESVSGPFSADIDGCDLTFRADAVGAGEIRISASDGIAAPVEASFKVSSHAKKTTLAEVYPTTVSDKLSIQGITAASIKVQIYNSTGRCVYATNIKADPFNPYLVDVSGLAPGRYTVLLSGSKVSSKTTIIKI